MMADQVAKLIRRGSAEQAGGEILLTNDVTTLGRAATCQKEWIETVWGYGYRLKI